MNVGICQPVTFCVAESTDNIDINQISLSEGKMHSIIQNSMTVPKHLEVLYEKSIANLEKEEQLKLLEALLRYQNVFARSDNDLGRTGQVKHKIETGDARPIRQKPRRIPIHMHDEVDKIMGNMIEQGIIEPSCSPWQSPVVLVRKPDNSLRFCVDYRKLNEVTTKDSYNIPNITESLDCLSGAKYYCSLDLASGYWQVEMNTEDKEKTAFSTPYHGLYHFNVMPFGLCNAPGTFERLMENVLVGLQFKTLLIYLDDIIIPCKTFEQGMEHLTEVFERLQNAGLKLKPRKCHLFQTEVIYLGHKVSEKGIETDPQKIAAIKEWPVPTNVHEIRSFIGLCSYYRKFIRDFSEIAEPLHKLTRKDHKFNWTDKCHSAFETLKEKLITSPILAYPSVEKSFILDTDASDYSIGAVLSQNFDDGEKVIAYGSKSFSNSERHYCVTRKELLAVVYFVKYFRHYLYGKKFKIRTDHSALKWLFNFKEPEGQVARWLESLSAFHFEIEHRPGRHHRNADGLSRIPCKQCKIQDWEELHVCAVTSSWDGNLKKDKQPSELNDDDKPERNTSEWRKGQLEDPIIGCFIRMKQNEESKPSWKDISHESQEFKTYWALWDQLDVCDGILYKMHEDSITQVMVRQIIVPSGMRKDILHLLHDGPTNGHLGVAKTLAKLRSRYYWNNCREDVENLCRSCSLCASRNNPRRKNRAPLTKYTVGLPLERIGIDILGPLPKSCSGMRYILVVVDYFTKWAEAYPMKNQEAETVAEKLVDGFITRFGVPRQIHTDQGRQFESKLFQELCQVLEIDKTRTTGFHPQSDGLVERFNRTLENMLSKFVSESQRDWDAFVPLLTMAYRATPQSSTGVSPNMMMLGREVNLPLDIMYEKLPDHIVDQEVEYITSLKERMEKAHDYARTQLGKNANRQKKYYDIKSSGKTFDTGDLVWLFCPRKKVGISPKLQRFWTGPYLIVEKVGDVLYRIQASKRSNSKVVHFDRLKAYHGNEIIDWTKAPSAPISPKKVNRTQDEYLSLTESEDELQHSTFDGIVGINVPSPCFIEEDEESCCAGATVAGKSQERTCGTQLSITGNCQDVGASCGMCHTEANGTRLHHINASRMSADQGSGSCLEHLRVAQGSEESDLGRPHVNPGTNSCMGIGTHQNYSGSVDVENQLDLTESVDSGSDIFLMEQEIEGSEDETGVANQEQLFAEGIEGTPSMLLCTRENVKTNKNEVTGKQNLSLRRSARTHRPPQRLIEEI